MVNVVNIFAVPEQKLLLRISCVELNVFCGKNDKENSFTRHFGEMEKQKQELKTTK